MKMNKEKRAEGHSSKVLGAVLDKISPEEQARTENRMLLAAKIDDGRKARGWTQNEFAAQMGKQPSEISKWLSGTHNFTSDTLWDIEAKLGIELISIKERKLRLVKAVVYKIVVSSSVQPSYVGFLDSSIGKKTYQQLNLA
jgi:transcriptional regulator with XRE-family HTH domain